MIRAKKIRLEEEWRRAEQSPDAATERLLTLTSKCSTTGFPTPTQHQKKSLSEPEPHVISSSFRVLGRSCIQVKCFYISWQKPRKGYISIETTCIYFWLSQWELQSSFLEIIFRFHPKWEKNQDSECHLHHSQQCTGTNSIALCLLVLRINTNV